MEDMEKLDCYTIRDLLEKFNENLANITRIYGGIADAISKGKEKYNGIKFTIG